MKTQNSWLVREQRWLYATGVLLLMLSMVFAAREYFLRSVTEQWPVLQQEVNGAQAQQIARHLDVLCQDLHGAGTSLLDAAVSGSDKDIGARMAARLREQEYSFELRDMSGTLIAYGGDPIFPQPEQPSPRTFSVYSRTPFLLLVANLHDDQRNMTLSVSTPIATSVPVSRRFLNSEGFLPELSRVMDIELVFSRQRIEAAQGHVLVPFVAGADTLGSITFEGIARETWLEQIASQFDLVLLILLLSVLLVASAPLFRLYRGFHPAIGAIVGILHVCAIRYTLLVAGFADGVFPDALLDPSHYASNFGWGLAASPGELTLSLLALLSAFIVLHSRLAAGKPIPSIVDTRISTVDTDASTAQLGISEANQVEDTPRRMQADDGSERRGPWSSLFMRCWLYTVSCPSPFARSRRACAVSSWIRRSISTASTDCWTNPCCC
jgi:hypothetical protein